MDAQEENRLRAQLADLVRDMAELKADVAALRAARTTRRK